MEKCNSEEQVVLCQIDNEVREGDVGCLHVVDDTYVKYQFQNTTCWLHNYTRNCKLHFDSQML